jgi:hypothetical protein
MKEKIDLEAYWCSRREVPMSLTSELKLVRIKRLRVLF